MVKRGVEKVRRKLHMKYDQLHFTTEPNRGGEKEEELVPPPSFPPHPR
jgi:hypothetical protein